jgi:putative spermidine/putrescine transport system ATP-binding protein
MLQRANPTSMIAQPLTLDGVTHSYGAGLAVDNVTLEVKGGELIAQGNRVNERVTRG